MSVAAANTGERAGPKGLSRETQEIWLAAQAFRRRADALAQLGQEKTAL